MGKRRDEEAEASIELKQIYEKYPHAQKFVSNWMKRQGQIGVFSELLQARALIEFVENFATVEDKNAKFFYTTHTPYKWSSGPTVHVFDDDHQPIASLEAAELLALQYRVISYGDNRVDTTYGVMYETPTSY